MSGKTLKKLYQNTVKKKELAKEDFYSWIKELKNISMKTSTKRKAISKKVKNNDVQGRSIPLYEEWNDLPDSEATVDQVRQSMLKGYLNKIEEENKPNYWKYACIAILLGIVVGMITFTPTITSMFDVCLLNK